MSTESPPWTFHDPTRAKLRLTWRATGGSPASSSRLDSMTSRSSSNTCMKLWSVYKSLMHRECAGLRLSYNCFATEHRRLYLSWCNSIGMSRTSDDTYCCILCFWSFPIRSMDCRGLDFKIGKWNINKSVWSLPCKKGAISFIHLPDLKTEDHGITGAADSG